ncbi:MAG: hypothetical protein IJF69_03370 [Clostridia bacterium]|nr:hypothetical protein [Clostridia bacterium]
MKLKTKAAVIATLAVAAVTFLTGCSIERSPYEINNEENYTVSVKFDANGGTFTTNTSVIVDSYNVADIDKNDDGIAEIPLIAPDDENRGRDAFTATKNDYFLAGWYAERTETEDSAGNKTYTYANKWDFEKDTLDIDPSKEYSAEEPVITLYAAWVPLFEIEFYSLDSGEYMNSLIFDPTTQTDISVPAWNEETGTIEMYDFPARKGYTFNGAYYDKDAEKPVDGAYVTHPGIVDYETGTAKDHVTKLYVDWTEGEWYRIYTAEQFCENASVNGHYEILADLDFEGENWPTSFMYNNFNGEIRGNSHVMKNIEIVQTNNSKVNAGLFGNLTENASLSDITFENVSFTIKAGTRVVGTSYGLFAGTVSKDAALSGVVLKNSVLQIDSSCYFGVDDYSIGMICGMGDPSVITAEGLSCIAVGDAPETIKITVDGNTVTVEEVTE